MGVATAAAPAANASAKARPKASALESIGNNVAGMDAIQKPADVLEFA
jgi:hypothetical protein